MQLLEITESPSANAQELIDIIKEAAERAASLTRKLLDFSRKGQMEETPISVHAAVQTSLEILSRSIDKKIEITSELAALEDIIMGDYSQLQNIFLNLGINAADAMPQGGLLLFQTEKVELSDHYCRTSLFNIGAGPYIHIRAMDTGTGVPEEIKEKIFDPFFTTKEAGKGTGLGLASVFGIVKQHRGEITVENRSDRSGAIFHLYFPLLDSDEALQPMAPETVVIGSGTILVVDDEEIIRITVEALLEQLGYHVLLACNGEEAVAIYQEQVANIDLVILDMIMPQMNGLDCLKALKKINPDVRAIMASGFSQEDDWEMIQKEGLLGFVAKPYTTGKLSQAIANALQTQ